MERMTLEARLALGMADQQLSLVYGADRLEEARARCMSVVTGFVKNFDCLPEALFSAPGRSELGGNHTDHENGQVLAAAVDLDLVAAAAANQSGMIRVQSQGYPLIVVDLKELTPKPEEENTSAALIRGVAARLAALGCSWQNAGLDLYMISSVPGGSGLSSSAAFEVLIGTVLNNLFFDSKCNAVEIAQIGQYAENVFFGKPCGLMDQMASSVGGVVAIDFADTAHPSINEIALDLTKQGYALCILDSGAGHADLTNEYAAITDELRAVCQHFGKTVLREVDENAFVAELPAIRAKCGDRAAIRAFHIFAENRRASAEAIALHNGDFERFLQIAHESGRSSAMYLQNVIPTGQTTHQELMLTIALCESILNGQGAVRVHGGGFGGTAQAFVPLDMLDEFKKKTESVLGEGSCHVLRIRPVGGVRLA